MTRTRQEASENPDAVIARLADVARARGADPLEPVMVALGWTVLLAGVRQDLRKLFLLGVGSALPLTTPERSGALDMVWRMLTGERPWLSSIEGHTIGWLNRCTDSNAEAVRAVFRTCAEVELEELLRHPKVAGDLLGYTYATLRGHGDKRAAGAFYTPPALSDLLAGLTTRPGEQDGGGTRRIITDPCCGSGALLLAHVRKLRRDDPEALDTTVFVAQDKDPWALFMTGIQLCSLGAAHVQLRLGDTLAPTCETVAST